MPGADSDQGQPLPPTDLLQSWKEIAAYLDATERSAQRWEQLEGLPVHRQIRNKRSAVYAYKSEIEQWRRSRSTPPAAAPDEDSTGMADGEAPAPSRWRFWAPVAGGLALVGLALLYWTAAGPPAPPRVGAIEAMPEIEGAALSPSISPDGLRAAFAWQQPGKRDFDLAVLEAGANTPRVLRDGPMDETAPVWSPDGSRLAFCRVPAGDSARLGELMVMSADGAEESSVTRVRLPPRFTSWNFGHYFAWTPDGESLIAPPVERGAGAGLVRVDLSGGESEILTDPGPRSYDTAPALSPDGRLLAFLRSTTPIQTDVYVVDLQAAERIPVRLTTEGGWAGPPAFSEQGDFVLATVGRLGGRRRLLALDPGGERPPVEIEGAPQDIYGVSVSADGKRVTALSGELEVDLYRATLEPDGARIEKLLERPGVEGLPTLSPDGTQLAFCSYGGTEPEGLWLADALGKGARLLTGEVGMLGGPASWSPDGRLLAFASADAAGQHLYVAAVEGGAVTQLSSGPERAFPPRWSRDGKGLKAAIAGPEGAPRAFSLAYPSGEIEKQSDTSVMMVEDFPGGGYAMVDAARELSVQRRGRKERVAELYWRHNFEVRGSGLVFLRHNGPDRAPTAEVLERPAGEPRVLTELPHVWRGFTASADYSTLYFDRLERESSGLRRFTLER